MQNYRIFIEWFYKFDCKKEQIVNEYEKYYKDKVAFKKATFVILFLILSFFLAPKNLFLYEISLKK